MHVWRGVLEVGVLGGNEGFDILHFVEAWFETTVGKIVVCELVGVEEFFLRTILYGNRSNEVGAIDEEDDRIRVAAI